MPRSRRKKKEIKVQKIRDLRKVEELKEIIAKAEEHVVVKNFINSLPDIINVQGTDGMFQLKSCIADKPQTFINRDAIVKQIISFLVESGCGIVCIVGEPGLGKTTVAVEVSHHLSNDHDIVVIFSSLLNAAIVAEVRRRICRDVGVNAGKDPKMSLMFWLKSIETKDVLVIDNVKQLLESKVKSEFTEFVLSLRNHSHQHIQFLTISRNKFSVSVNHQTEELDELDKRYSVELIRKCCPDVEVADSYRFELAYLCGFVPLAFMIFQS